MGAGRTTSGRLAAAALWLLLSAPALGAPQVVRVGVEERYPPFLFVDQEGQPRGIAIDHLRLLEADGTLRFEVAATGDLDTLLEGARRGELDLHPALMETPDRGTFLRFTRPYFSVPAVLVVRQGSGQASLDGLRGARVAVGRGYAVEAHLRRRHPELVLAPATDDQTCLRMLASGSVEGAVVDLASASWIITNTPLQGLEVRSDVGFTYSLSMGVRPDRPELLAALEAGLSRVTPDQARRIREAWVRLTPAEPLAPHVIEGPLVVAGLALLAWAGVRGVNWALRRKVEERTRALGESEERYRTLVENMQEGLTVFDLRAGRYTYVSPVLPSLNGFTEEEFRGMRLETSLGRVHPDDRSAVEAQLRALERGEVTHLRGEYRWQVRSGEYRWFSDSRTAIRDEGGRPVRLVGVTTDITERKAAEAARSEAVARYRELYESLSDGIVASDALGRITEFNEAFRAMLGYGADELRGKRFPELTPASGQAEEVELYLEHFRSHRPTVTHEKDYVRKDGTVFPVEIRSSVEYGADGAPVALRALVRDITSRRQAEAARAEKARELELILRTALDGFWMFDPAGRVLEANDAICELLGFTREELVGRSVQELGRPEDAGGFEPRLRAIRQGGKAGFESVLLRKDGRPVEVEVSARWVEVAGGRIIAFVRDVTARHQAEERLRQSQKMEAVGRLAGGVAHDFNNLLTVILLTVELANEDAAGNERVLSDLGEIQSAGNKAKAVTRQLLAFSRQQVLDARPLDLNEVIRDVERLLRRLLGEHVALRTELAPHLPPVLADAGQLQQVLLNLAINAGDAMPRGGTLTVRSETAEEAAADGPPEAAGAPRPGVGVSVEDTGVGMDAATRARLFEPFFTTKPPGKGTGLGLSTVFGIIKQSGGRISVDSAPGRGTRFHFWLPAVTEARAPAGAEGASAPPSGLRETVLVLEDDETVRRVTVRSLLGAGLAVLSAGSVPEALRLVEAHGRPPSVLLTDVRMPTLSGPEAAVVLERSLPGLRTVFMSGYSSDEAPELGAVPAGALFVQKPFTTEALLAKIREAVGAGRTGGPRA